MLAPAKPGGEEHLVWHDEAHDRYIKLTKPNCFGLTVAAEWFLDDERDEADLKPAMCGATPLEYLERLLLQNEVFGDEIELLGIVDKRQALHVVTAQPTIVGGAVGRGDHQLHVRTRLSVAAGHSCRTARRRIVPAGRRHPRFRCHPANFLGASSDIFPIDVLLVRADEELLTALAAVS